MVVELREHPCEERRADCAEHEAEGDPAPRQGARAAQCGTGWRRRLGPGLATDHVDVQADPGSSYHGIADRAVQQLSPARLSAGSEHDLGRVERAGGIDERLADIGARHLSVAPSHALDEPSLLLEQRGRGGG